MTQRPVIATIPDCAGNSIAGGVDEPCPESVAACPPGQIRLQFYQGPPGSTIGSGGPWTHLYTACTVPPEPDEPVVVLTLEEFRRLPLPAGTSKVEPPNGYALVTMPTNVFTTSTEPVLLETTVVGVPVQVRATPARWAWDFGDGEGHIGPTDLPGAAYPALTLTYAYPSRGSYEITMTTHYTGEYSLDGGSTWSPVVGEALVDSPPTAIQVLAGHNQLVAEPLDP